MEEPTERSNYWGMDNENVAYTQQNLVSGKEEWDGERHEWDGRSLC